MKGYKRARVKIHDGRRQEADVFSARLRNSRHDFVMKINADSRLLLLVVVITAEIALLL
jgi:hypothetical protein